MADSHSQTAQKQIEMIQLRQKLQRGNEKPGATTLRSDLRDLAAQIEAVAKEHIAWPAAREAIANLLDHLHAKAGHEELVKKLADTETR